MVAIAIGYLIIGVLVMAWFLTDIYRAKQHIEHSDGTTQERRIVSLMHPPLLAGFLIFLLTLWPLAVITYLLSNPEGEEEDPQDRVPPEYR